MSVVFIIFNFLLLILRTILAVPIIVLRNFIPFIRKRLEFERKNIFNSMSQSFKRKKIKADYFFHISSEGELEQCRPLIEYFLQQNAYIELCYTSDSVEDKCLKIYSQNSNFIRIYRLPLLSFFPFSFLYFQSIYNFITAPTVIMCRYDFFPELLLLKFLGKKMILVSAATKKMSWYKKEAINLFEVLIASSPMEKAILTKLFPDKKIEFFDFRIPRIFQRQDQISNLLTQNIGFKKLIDHYSLKNSTAQLIIGSCWESDLVILKNDEIKKQVIAGELIILIAPHKLKREFTDNLKEKLISIFGSELVGYFNGDSDSSFFPVTISLIPGILCELYSVFDMVYVGGGYEKSIHSVLEPFLMGSKIIIGPKINRSTEYDFIYSTLPDEIAVLKNPDLFYNIFKQLLKVEKNMSFRKQLKNNSRDDFSKMIALISGNLK